MLSAHYEIVMIKLKTTHEILTMPWKESTTTMPAGSKIPPAWPNDQAPQIADIHFWEELYYEPGNIGVYVSWSPFVEFYMIAYNLFANQNGGIETFYGPTAATEVSEKLSKLRINLPTNKIWVS